MTSIIHMSFVSTECNRLEDRCLMERGRMYGPDRLEDRCLMERGRMYGPDRLEDRCLMERGRMYGPDRIRGPLPYGAW